MWCMWTICFKVIKYNKCIIYEIFQQFFSASINVMARSNKELVTRHNKKETNTMWGMWGKIVFKVVSMRMEQIDVDVRSV